MMTRSCRLSPFALLLLATCSTPALAQSRVVHVEEHWELELGQPDHDRSAPQTTMVQSSQDNLAGLHFLFTLNHVAVPDYAAGGMQIQAWDGGQLVEHRTGNEYGAFYHSHETVKWVQALTLSDNVLTFKIRDGHSETWGRFGGSDLTLSVGTTLESLNNYRPGVSLTESQVNYAENRVDSLTLTKIRWITDDGQVHEMNAPIAIDTSLDP